MNVLALAYGVGAIVNILWPRPQSPADPWYAVYGMLATTAGVVVIGAVYMVIAKPYERGNAPAGDAHAGGAKAAGGGFGGTLEAHDDGVGHDDDRQERAEPNPSRAGT